MSFLTGEFNPFDHWLSGVVGSLFHEEPGEFGGKKGKNNNNPEDFDQRTWC